MTPGILELDLHGKNTYQAKVALEAALRRAGAGTYRIRIIHGYYGAHPRVKRVEGGFDPGITDLVLREF